MFIFSLFSQSQQPKPIANPPQVPVLSGAKKCPKSKKKHCDATKGLNLALEEVSSYLEATISSKDDTDNPSVKKNSKRKSSEERTTSSKMNAPKKSKPVLKLKRCDANDNSQNINPPEKATEIGDKNGSSIAPTPENQALEPKNDSVAPENKSSPPAIDIETYEEKRLRNIAERKKKFNELHLTEKRLLVLGKKTGVTPTPTPESEPAPKNNKKIVKNPFYKPNSTSVNTSSKKKKHTNSQGQLISE